jgi:hypothetical protein
MTDERRPDSERAPWMPEPAAEPAGRPTEADEPLESASPSEAFGPAPSAPDPAAPDVPAPDEGEQEAQSKFARPASTLGLRPSPEQSKAGSGVPAGLGSIPRPVPAPANPPTAASSGPVLPPVRTAPIPPVPPSPAVPPSRVAATTASAVPTAAAAAAPTAGAPDVAADDVPTWGERFRSLSPALVTLSIGSVGALLFLIFVMTSHTTPVAVLLSAGVVVTLAFAADAVIASVATWRAAVWDEDPGRALLLAVLAGGSAVVCAGSLGATTVLLMVLNGF